MARIPALCGRYHAISFVARAARVERSPIRRRHGRVMPGRATDGGGRLHPRWARRPPHRSVIDEATLTIARTVVLRDSVPQDLGGQHAVPGVHG